MADKVYKIRDSETGEVFQIRGPDDATPDELQAAATSHIAKRMPSFKGVESGSSSSAEPTSAVTGSAVSPRSNTRGQSAVDIATDIGKGAMRTAVNMGTHVGEAALIPGELAGKALTAVAPSIGEPYSEAVKGGQETFKKARDWWNREYETTGPMGTAANLATDVIATAGVGGPAAGIARRILPRAAEEATKRTVGRVALTGGTAGAAGGALTSEDAGEGAAWGAGIGAILPLALRKVLLGTGKSRAAQALLEEDVPLTVGQAATRTGAGTVTTAGEQAGRWLPLTGQAIENRQQEAVRGWRDATLRRANIPETPHGPAVLAGTTKSGAQSVEDVIDAQRAAFDQRYGQAVRGTEFIPDEELEKGLLRILHDPRADNLLDERGRQLVQDAYKRVLQGRVRSRPVVQPTAEPSPLTREGPPTSMSTDVAVPGRGVAPQGRAPVGPARPQPTAEDPFAPPTPGNAYWTGEDLMHARRTLNRYGHKLVSNPDPYKAATGSALRDLADEVLNLMSRQNAPVGQTISTLRAPYSALRTLEDAAAASSNQGGFTPAQLIRFAQRSSNEELERLGRQAGEVFSGTNTGARSSGIDLRSLTRVGGIPGGLMIEPTTLVGAAAGAAAYRPAVQRMLLGQTKPQKAIVKWLREHDMGDIVR